MQQQYIIEQIHYSKFDTQELLGYDIQKTCCGVSNNRPFFPCITNAEIDNIEEIEDFITL